MKHVEMAKQPMNKCHIDSIRIPFTGCQPCRLECSILLSFVLPVTQAIVTSQNFDGQDGSKSLSSRLLGIPRRKIGKGTRVTLPLLFAAMQMGSGELKNSACMMFCIAGIARTPLHVRGDVVHPTTKSLT
jgi:hypothetical protein